MLAEANREMQPVEIRRAVERRLGEPVRRSSINSCLSRSAKGDEGPVERIRPGAYRVRPK